MKPALRAAALGAATIGGITLLIFLYWHYFPSSGGQNIFEQMCALVGLPAFLLIGGANGASEFEAGAICVILNSLIASVVFPIVSKTWKWLAKPEYE